MKRADRVLTNGVPELRKMLTDGEVGLLNAADVAQMPERQQKAAVKKGAEGVKAQAERARRARKRLPDVNKQVADPREAECHRWLLSIEPFTRKMPKAFSKLTGKPRKELHDRARRFANAILKELD